MLADNSHFDLIIIGGGINGAAIAREAACSGLSALLLEREDFGGGTSAASTRLIHGGLRYLEHAEFSLVRESLHERERLLRTAPHLVEPLQIVLPLMRGSRRGPMTIRAGMWLYDLLSLGKSVPRHRMLSRQDVIDQLPGIAASELVGGAAYFDAQVRFPERLVLENALDAEAAGATLANYTEARELVVENGRIAGVVWQSGDARGTARAPVVVNAAGPWVDQVLGPHGDAKLIGGTRGSHLVARRFTGAPPHAVYAEAGSDARPFFIIPWNGLYLIGTTDERDAGDPGAARMNQQECEYLLGETRRLFPGASDLREMLCYSYAGIRPLPSTAGIREGAITRRHLIKAHARVRGLFSIVGGKLTTHRSLAESCLRRIARVLGKLPPGPTRSRVFPGAASVEERDGLLAALGSGFGDVTALRLWRTYGKRSLQIQRLIQQNADLGLRLGPDCGVLVGELVHALTTEHAHTLTDLLQRRIMVGLDSDFGRRSAPLAADWLVRLGIWDKSRAEAEITAYRAWARRFAVPGAPVQ